MKTKETTHTPTPWILMNKSEYWDNAEIRHSGKVIARDVHTTDAEMIVRAVNSHEALLEAAKKVVKEYRDLPNDPDFAIIKAMDDLQDAIAQASGETNA